MVQSKVSNKYALYVDAKTQALITEKLIGEVPVNNVKFPVELGEEHPFDMAQMDGIYEKFGPATGVIDKYVDYIVGPGFYVTSKNAKVVEILENFMHDVNMDTVLREWVKQALIKGSSPLEIGYDKNNITELKVLNADDVYVKRDRNGNVLGYTQYVGKFDKINKSRIIEFKPHQIAFLAFNKKRSSPYGIGILYPTLTTINYILQSEKDMHVLQSRKANSPLHIKLGNMDKEDIPTEDEVSSFGQKLEYMTNKQEWATGPNVEMKVVDFGNVADKFNFIMESDLRSFRWAVQIPEMLMGEGNIAEGLGNVQMDGWMRRVQSFQAEIEKIIELEIFEPVLKTNGVMGDAEMEWGTPSNTETDARITKLTALLSNPMLSPAMFDEIEKELARLLKLDETKLESPEAQRAKEEKRSQPVIPGQQSKPAEEPKELTKFYSTEWVEGEIYHGH